MLKPMLAGVLAVSILGGKGGLVQLKKPVILKGLDPVLLVKGKEVKGNDAISKEFGKFTYLFASSADKLEFEKTPKSYAVQNNGMCLHMEGMPGDPGLFLVYDGKIYLAGSSVCLAAVKKDPAAYIHPPKPGRKVAILIFPGVEIIDYTGPWEVFGGAGYKVFTVAAKPDPVTTAMGMTVVPDYTFENCPAADILLLPGGAVDHQISRSNPTLQWIKKRVPSTVQTMSVCNGAFWLANSGLLDGKEAITTNGWVPTLMSEFPKVQVRRDKRFTDNGQIMTTGGLTAGIDGALHVVEKLEGVNTANAVALGLEYNWRANATYTRASMADRYLIRLGRLALPAGCSVEHTKNEGDADRWELAGRITNLTAPPDQLLPQIVGAIEQGFKAAGWSKLGATSETDHEATWAFKGDDGQPWTVVFRVAPEKGAQGKYLETLVLSKAGQ